MNDAHDNAQTDKEMLQRLSRPQPATDKQINYFRDLVVGRDWEQAVSEIPPPWQELFHAIVATSETQSTQQYAKTDVSKFIDLLLKCPKTVNIGTAMHAFMEGQPYKASQATTVMYQPLTDGMYSDNGHIYKVYHTVHGANQQVAKRLTIKDNKPTKGGHVAATFKYEGKAPLKFLKPEQRLTIEQAAEFGKLYGICCICGRTLTNELSIHLGIGPICGKREFGGSFEFLINKAKAEVEPSQHHANILDGE